MPPKLRQRRNQREVSVRTEHSQVESAVNAQGQDPPQPPLNDPNQGEKDAATKTPPENEEENQEKPHQDSGSHEKEATFVTMSDVANLLKQEREKNPKEPRLFVRKPPYPIELLKQPYPEKYVAQTFSCFDGQKGSALVHISKFIDSMRAYAGNGDLCLREFSKSFDDRAYTWYTTLPPGSVKVWKDMVKLFCGKYFQAEEKITLVNLHTTKQTNGEDLLRYIHRFREISLDCYANYEEGELVGVCIDNMLPEFRAHLENLDILRFAQLLQKARKTALLAKPHTEKPKEKKSQPQVLTIIAILDKWVADGIVKLPEISKKVTEEDKKNPKFCYFHQYVHHSTADCWTLRRKFHEKIQDGTLELPQTRQKVHIDPFPKHKEKGAVSVVIHGSASDADGDEPVAANSAMTPAAIKTLQRNPRFRSLFNQLGLNPEARTAATEAIMAIAADSGAHCFTAETHASRAFLETTNAITFTDEDMEVQYPDHRRPLYLSATINEVQVRRALVGPIVALTRFHIVDSVVPYHILLGRPWLHKYQLIPSTYHQCVKGRLNGKPIWIAANSTPFDQSESYFVEAALYDEITPTGEASLAKPIGIPLPKWEEIKDALEADLRDLLERKKKRKAEASASKGQPQYPKLVAHSLNVELGTRPVVQPMRTFHPEVEAQITQEVKKLLSAGFIKPIQHPRWLFNIVPVKKKNGQIRCCVDFRNLNKACPKDEFSMPNMDLLIDSAAGHAMFSFMNGFSGYNQIFMSPRDVEKTAFRTPIENFYYTVMPFGLKNAGATYQRTMTAMFHDMMHREIEDYVDDIVVKSKTREDHFGILKKVFERCRLYKLKMNPLKCAFEVSAGKFLGFLVHQRGIDVDPARASVIATMKPPITHKELKSFLGKLSYIRRFIPGLAAVTSTFAPLLKKGAPFHWSTECQEAFEKVQLIAKSHPIRSLLQRPVLSGRLAQWLLQLSQYEIIAETPTAIKSLADSIWTSKFDGSSTATSAGADIVLYKDNGEAVTKSFKFDFPCSNNAAEYEAYLVGLAIAYEMGIKHLRVIGDSNLVVCQARGEFSLKEPSLAPYRALAQKLEAKFSTFEIEHAQRNENRYADVLATLGSQIAFEGEEMNVTICKKTQPIIELLKKSWKSCLQIKKTEDCLGEFWRAALALKKQRKGCLKSMRKLMEMEGLSALPQTSAAGIFLAKHECRSSRDTKLVPNLLIPLQQRRVANFIREYIITHFSIPYKLITDNGTPFINKDMQEVLEHYRVKHRRSTPYYPQGNGQAEATNRMLLRILSKMVFDYRNDWKAHLADVLWAYRSSPKTATGSELEVDADICAEARMADLEGLDEARDLAKAKSQRNYQKMANTYSKALRVRIFAEGQMVLKVAEFVRRNLPSPSKFSPNWDGPYIIREAHGSGYYRLSKSDETCLSRSLLMENG
uniref:Integrase catalytic domain-containing protein n=1 Tax=Fagus sylvatica TaxID=28930 RepID=A0A2N9G246_FAGSY